MVVTINSNQTVSKILSQLHESHQGTVRTKQQAHLSLYYWSGIDNGIDKLILVYQVCHNTPLSNVKEPRM